MTERDHPGARVGTFDRPHRRGGEQRITDPRNVNEQKRRATSGHQTPVPECRKASRRPRKPFGPSIRTALPCRTSAGRMRVVSPERSDTLLRPRKRSCATGTSGECGSDSMLTMGKSEKIVDSNKVLGRGPARIRQRDWAWRLAHTGKGKT